MKTKGTREKEMSHSTRASAAGDGSPEDSGGEEAPKSQREQTNRNRTELEKLDPSICSGYPLVPRTECVASKIRKLVLRNGGKDVAPGLRDFPDSSRVTSKN